MTGKAAPTGAPEEDGFTLQQRIILHPLQGERESVRPLWLPRDSRSRRLAGDQGARD